MLFHTLLITINGKNLESTMWGEVMASLYIIIQGRTPIPIDKSPIPQSVFNFIPLLGKMTRGVPDYFVFSTPFNFFYEAKGTFSPDLIDSQLKTAYGQAASMSGRFLGLLQNVGISCFDLTNNILYVMFLVMQNYWI